MHQHTCHHPGCTTPVPPKLWGCRKHWYRLPKYLRDKIWATYRPGQEITKTPSKEYLAVADEVERWCRNNPETMPKTASSGRPRKVSGQIIVANKYHGIDGINIMRGTPLGNPFRTANDRLSCIDRYREWLRQEWVNRSPAASELIRLARLVQQGEDITLVCCCKPKPCHGDVVKAAIEGIINKWAEPLRDA